MEQRIDDGGLGEGGGSGLAAGAGSAGRGRTVTGPGVLEGHGEPHAELDHLEGLEADQRRVQADGPNSRQGRLEHGAKGAVKLVRIHGALAGERLTGMNGAAI